MLMFCWHDENCTKSFTDMQGKNNMSDELMEIFHSASKGNISEKKNTVLNETAPSPCTNGKQTSL
jgi:hypothetical protein